MASPRAPTSSTFAVTKRTDSSSSTAPLANDAGKPSTSQGARSVLGTLRSWVPQGLTKAAAGVLRPAPAYEELPSSEGEPININKKADLERLGNELKTKLEPILEALSEENLKQYSTAATLDAYITIQQNALQKIRGETDPTLKPLKDKQDLPDCLIKASGIAIAAGGATMAVAHFFSGIVGIDLVATLSTSETVGLEAGLLAGGATAGLVADLRLDGSDFDHYPEKAKKMLGDLYYAFNKAYYAKHDLQYKESREQRASTNQEVAGNDLDL